MSNRARTPVHFPRMKVRGGRNRTPYRRISWAVQSMKLAFESLNANFHIVIPALSRDES